MNDVAPAAFVDTTLLAPIAGAAPAGRDLTYEPHLEKLAAEVEKAASISGEIPDWAYVRRESSRILRDEAKDLRVASWWVASGAFVEGWSAVAEGVTTYGALMDQFWGEMYPPLKRPRARAGLISWLWETLARALAPRAITMADADAIRAIEAAVLGIDRASSERLGDASPSLGPMRSLVREKVRSIPEPAVAVVSQGVANGSASTVVAPLPVSVTAPVEVGAVASLDDAENAATRFRDGLGTLAHHARGAAPTSPWPYRLARVAAWLTVESAPDVENGRTFVRAPRAPERNGLQETFDAGDWSALREAAEDALTEHVFWLDLNRSSAIALERLGPPFAAARAALGRETVAFVERIPSLPSLLFSNGTPFASPETVDWLVAEAARYGASAAGPHPAEKDDALEPLVAEAQARVAAGEVDEALATLLSSARGAPAARVRFRARLVAAQIAHRSGKSELARALLEELLPEVNATLEAWEPALCAEFFESFLKLEKAASPEGGDRQALLFRRLLQLDAFAALRHGG